MSLMTWSDIFLTGIGEVDNQHKKLIGLTNQLDEAVQRQKGAEVVGRVLSDLTKYIAFHFGYEEILMDQIKYADSPAHISEHVEFAGKIEGFKKSFDSGDSEVSVEVLNFLRDWLTHHIMKTDRKLAQSLGNLGVK